MKKRPTSLQLHDKCHKRAITPAGSVTRGTHSWGYPDLCLQNWWCFSSVRWWFPKDLPLKSKTNQGDFDVSSWEVEKSWHAKWAKFLWKKWLKRKIELRARPWLFPEHHLETEGAKHHKTHHTISYLLKEATQLCWCNHVQNFKSMKYLGKYGRYFVIQVVKKFQACFFPILQNIWHWRWQYLTVCNKYCKLYKVHKTFERNAHCERKRKWFQGKKKSMYSRKNMEKLEVSTSQVNNRIGHWARWRWTRTRSCSALVKT